MKHDELLNNFSITDADWQSLLVKYQLEPKAMEVESVLEDIWDGKIAYEELPGVLAFGFDIDYVTALKFYQDFYIDYLQPKINYLTERYTEYLSASGDDADTDSYISDIKADLLSGRYAEFIALPEFNQLISELKTGFKANQLENIKADFYNGINEKERMKFITSAAKLFYSGRAKDLFQGDERYVKFWRSRILKDKGLEGGRKFDDNPLRREQFGSFIRHVMEERFEIPASDAVMWGVFFSSLAYRAGDTNYDRLAYGDLADQQFKWNL